MRQLRQYEEHPHLGGVQRLYDLGNGYTLSAINAPMVHAYSYAWELAVLNNATDMPLGDSVVVTMSQEEADEFIERAFQWAEATPA